MTTLRRISDWLKYERLHHYPALAAFDRAAALKRLEAYEREEREACQPWLTTVHILIGVLILLWVAVAYFHPIANGFMIVIQIPGWVLQFTLHRRIREASGSEGRRRAPRWSAVEVRRV